MSTKAPSIIDEKNLSHAWGRAFLMMMERSKSDLTPLTISISGFVDNLPHKDNLIIQALDSSLVSHQKYKSKISAMVIFPFDLWVNAGKPGYEKFRKWYLTQFLPRLKAANKINSRGTYFGRMVDFDESFPDSSHLDRGNQLGHIINIWARDCKNGKRPRKSALQVACFNPAKDHTGSIRSGFPCLQQVGFSYDEDIGLAVNAYYPSQYIFDRAYGNYLGLCHLGNFMAHQLDMKLVRLNCFIGNPELSNDVSKTSLRELEKTVRETLNLVDRAHITATESTTI